MTNREQSPVPNQEVSAPKRLKLLKFLSPLTMTAVLMIAGAIEANATSNKTSEQSPSQATATMTPVAESTVVIGAEIPNPTAHIDYFPYGAKGVKIGGVAEPTYTPVPSKTPTELPPPSPTNTPSVEPSPSRPVPSPTNQSNIIAISPDTAVYTNSPDVLDINTKLKNLDPHGKIEYDNATIISADGTPLAHRIKSGGQIGWIIASDMTEPVNITRFDGRLPEIVIYLVNKENRLKVNFVKDGGILRLPGAVVDTGAPEERAVTVEANINAIDQNDEPRPLRQNESIGIVLGRGTFAEGFNIKKGGNAQGLELVSQFPPGLIFQQDLVENGRYQIGIDRQIIAPYYYNFNLSAILEPGNAKLDGNLIDDKGVDSSFSQALRYPLNSSNNLSVEITGSETMAIINELAVKMTSEPDSLLNYIVGNTQQREELLGKMRLRRIGDNLKDQGVPIAMFFSDRNPVDQLNALLNHANGLDLVHNKNFLSFIRTNANNGVVLNKPWLDWMRQHEEWLEWGVNLTQSNEQVPAGTSCGDILKYIGLNFSTIPINYEMGDKFETIGMLADNGKLSPNLIAACGKEDDTIKMIANKLRPAPVMQKIKGKDELVVEEVPSVMPVSFEIPTSVSFDPGSLGNFKETLFKFQTAGVIIDGLDLSATIDDRQLSVAENAFSPDKLGFYNVAFRRSSITIAQMLQFARLHQGRLTLQDPDSGAPADGFLIDYAPALDGKNYQRSLIVTSFYPSY